MGTRKKELEKLEVTLSQMSNQHLVKLSQVADESINLCGYPGGAFQANRCIDYVKDGNLGQDYRDLWLIEN